ncbi:MULTISPECIES: FadR/GntR family transcriptional regulator [Prauserella salsuginis group]|uniref:DNA-binding FadR family transcriptional regulator n=2 Tax=Prauserella salsuginis group TaxID=2893672 RepID=A0A839XKW8_9PSEU|nr:MULTISPECIES: FadR/GntR family transcriptional regulator [Prauserella salsuginis group]MBB3661373.1 DNA-binding FadR family transcriptional regulator [Prauserella sediminis]MCR3719295.1 DNA-binding transcriptional regulator, FadR family [Prauserella flava]MCR3735692.1 DNA-binding transcriptional regulator, FadR family [Prauserella salsuginis]
MTSDAAWEPVRRVRTHEQVLAQIQQKILDGTLSAGERLPSERELVNMLGVSRTSVREALRALEAMGIVESRTGSGQDAGSVITATSTPAMTNLLRLHIALARISLSDLVDTRVELERSAARGAASVRTDDDLRHLVELLDQMRSTDSDPYQFNTLDTEFHVSIARISGNALAVDLMQALRGAVEHEMAETFAQLEDWRAAADGLVDEHEAIYRAIEKGSGELAANLVADHITTFYRDRIAGR